MGKRRSEGPPKKTGAKRPAADAATLREPEAFGRYRVEGILGEGSMGRVYRAFDPLAQRRVAIKTAKPEYRTGPGAEDYLARFRREAQAAAGLSSAHIVTVFDVGEDFFVMELLEGATLDELLLQRGRLSPSETLSLLIPVGEAVDLAHAAGIVHRDIKPANIFLLRDGRPKIMDFGVAHVPATVITAAGEFWGSPSYMAPEQITRSEASPSTDLFALGVVAYQMLTGRKPFEGETVPEVLYRVVHSEPAKPSEWNADLPARYDEVFRRALAKEPSLRYPNATALVASLGRREADSVASGLEPPRRAQPSDTRPVSPGEIETQEIPGRDLRSPSQETPKSFAASGPQPRPRPRTYAIGGALVVAAALLVGRGVLAHKPASASLTVTTEPPNAMVRIDGVPLGATPLQRAGLAEGGHTIQVELAGYAPAELTLELKAGDLPTPIEFVLKPTSGILEVRSEPPGASVRLDGAPVGVTPVERLSAVPGRHEVAIEAPGYKPWSQAIDVVAGAPIALKAALAPAATRSSAALGKLGWVRAGDLEALGPGVTPPKKLAGEPAPYPPAARAAKMQGTVVAELTVTENGEPDELRVIQSAGDLLDSAFLATLRTWRYEPAQKEGVRVRARIREEQQFVYHR